MDRMSVMRCLVGVGCGEVAVRGKVKCGMVFTGRRARDLSSRQTLFGKCGCKRKCSPSGVDTFAIGTVEVAGVSGKVFES